MTPNLKISTLTFSDGTVVDMEGDDLILIVGPNNAGKSRALRDILMNFDGKSSLQVVIDVKECRSGSVADVLDRAKRLGLVSSGSHSSIIVKGSSFSAIDVEYFWSAERIGPVAGVFTRFINTEERLRICNPAVNGDFISEALSHPIQFLYRDDRLEYLISDYFKAAFDMDLVVHRNAGKIIPLYCGVRPIPPDGKDRVSYEYIRSVEALDPVENQGDGIRGYVGVLLETIIGEWSIVLIDEPEAFLHPPQARLLGSVLASDKRSEAQTIISTHSADFVKGVLDAGHSKTRVLRLTRAGSVNHVNELQADEIKQLWTDPLLRYSNVLDGLFHEAVVLCESDSDCLLYGAVLDEICKSSPTRRRPDLLFLHCGGKSRMPVVIRALVRVGVPISTVADFDLLGAEEPLCSIVKAHGGDWKTVEHLWKPVYTAINGKKPELSTEETSVEVEKILRSVSGTMVFPKDAAKSIGKLMRRSTPWNQVKTMGCAYLKGQDYRNCELLLDALAKLRINIVPIGEIESFFPGADGHGPAFAADVLTRGMLSSEKADVIKSFVEQVVFSSVGARNL